jgi:hypothetical protein
MMSKAIRPITAPPPFQMGQAAYRASDRFLLCFLVQFKISFRHAPSALYQIQAGIYMLLYRVCGFHLESAQFGSWNSLSCAIESQL